MAIASYMRKYFWDINHNTARPKSHPDYYIKRILEMGDVKAYTWLKTVFGLKRIMSVSKKARLSPKSENYWKMEFARK